MIKSSNYYSFYISPINEEIKEKAKILSQLKRKHDIIKKILLNQEEEFNNTFNITLQDLFRLEHYKDIAKIKTSSNNYNLLDFSKNYLSIKYEYNSTLRYYNKLKQAKIQEKVFKFILKSFFLKIRKALLEGYIFKLAPLFGEIKIVKAVRKGRAINWGASIKNKKRLIQIGELPYCKEEEEEAIKQGKIYKGVKWQIEHPKIDFMVKWSIGKNTLKYYPIFRNYIFKPARGKTSLVSLLQEEKKDMKNALLKFDRI